MIYADNAATTRIDENALKKMQQCLEEYGNASQPYAFARTPKKLLKEARTQIAECIGAKENEIYFTSGGTESNNWVIKEYAASKHFDCHIVTTAIEHHAILNAAKSVEVLGTQVSYVGVDSSALINRTEFSNTLDTNGLVSVMFSNNEVGTIQPIKELCEEAHSKHYLFHTDAVQAVGHAQINVKNLGVDFLSASAHKFNGPKGIGFLYIREGVILPALMSGGSQEYGLRAGTENVPSIVAMATALKDNCRNMKENRTLLCRCEEVFIRELNALNVHYVRNGNKFHMPGIISISFPGIEGEILLHRLDLKGISVSTGSACDSKRTQISHVLTAMEIVPEIAESTIRISFGKYNTEDDGIILANVIAEIIDQLNG